MSLMQHAISFVNNHGNLFINKRGKLCKQNEMVDFYAIASSLRLVNSTS